MKYKIDTKENYDIITPLYAHFDSILAEQLNDLVFDDIDSKQSILLDLINIESLNHENVLRLEDFHNQMYQDNLSFVLCHLNTKCKEAIAQHKLEHVLNSTPTLIEAIDIISMEGLERELMNEE